MVKMKFKGHAIKVLQADGLIRLLFKKKSNDNGVIHVTVPWIMLDDIIYNEYYDKNTGLIPTKYVEFSVVYRMDEQYSKYLELCKLLGFIPNTGWNKIGQDNTSTYICATQEHNRNLICSYRGELFIVDKSLVTTSL